MILTKDNINSFLNKYIVFVNKISDYYNYDNNIKHLLYLIVPGFVAKYGAANEKFILNCFEKTKIYISEAENNIITATFNRILKKDGSSYCTEKYIILNQYKKASFTNLFDNIIHEFNHAVNSIHNEILEKDDHLYIRTGLTYIIYDKNTLKPISKEDNSIIEEIINTKQTEMLIDIINSFNQYPIHDREISNTLYSIGNSITNKRYRSGAYLLQSLLCQELMNNKTFIATLENLRFHGHVEDIQGWFDQITGIEGSFSKLVQLLSETLTLQLDISKKKGIKFLKVNKIKKMTKEALEIVRLFDQNCNYR